MQGSRLPLVALALLLVPALSGTAVEPAAGIPLPEHPRPDLERAEWVNLNGDWAFRFDAEGTGERERWFERAPAGFPLTIHVPFSWGSKLSGVRDEADVAWYARLVRVPEGWKGRRVFLVVGASDWKTTAWLDGEPIGGHQGGYTPFELELTKSAKPGTDQRLVLRVDDTPHPFKLEGKQGYGKARGLWQTVYLESRPAVYVDSLEFHPDLPLKRVELRVRLSAAAPAGAVVELKVSLPGAGEASEAQALVAEGGREVRLTLPLGASPRPWSLEDPYLYDATVTLSAGGVPDRVKTYFGLRSLGTAPLPGLGHPYVALNGRPVYLRMTLDQGWHPEGFYTWPSDAAMREEVLLARRLGLNTIRTHVKVELPRKLYWADRLGVLVMSDVPNSWGEPDEAMRGEWETAFRGMVRRDFNHPSIFSWVLFNEQWGLLTKDADGKASYRPETQEWVATRVDLAKQLDPTRLVEDNSPCCGGGHVKTDLNSWHMYLPGWKWKAQLDEAEAQTFPGSPWNYVGGRKQGGEPMLNSECGNVWGYEGSTGDVDWSFDYHAMMDELRRHPKVSGWLYTEHHDVVNEWNGYVRADRSEKETGLGELVPGMTLRDWHGPFYVAIGSYPATAAKPGETVSVPLWASFLTDASPGPELTMRLELVGHDDLGRFREWWKGERKVPFAPWTSRALEPVAVRMPDRRAVAVLRLALEDAAGRVLHRNFTAFVVGERASPRDEVVSADGRRLRVLRVAPDAVSRERWRVRSWDALEGQKRNGAGDGFFEYRLAWPRDLRPADVAGASFVAELGAKELFGKDRPEGGAVEGDFMRGRGTHDPGLNPNAYPMTDATRYPSAVRVLVNGVPAG
ncbi:MAG TPA: glycoside hydrolase family 2 TIM barrel-domain containing protein, partial [Vicinamibacteria bacterium]|nr:glycoside hydrolase family 2 TIM barrel-domain containing protein [Vicinamibacteria bacterium]